ncbi:uncharacterized protein DS421_1g15290 [Arachis hypogaea]|nr:uncharacterized protein DS421_1g15290 [Arachis hypogaea]
MILQFLPWNLIYEKTCFLCFKITKFNYPLLPFDAVICVLSTFRFYRAGMT